MSKTNTEKMAPETQTPEMANGTIPFFPVFMPLTT